MVVDAGGAAAALERAMLHGCAREGVRVWYGGVGWEMRVLELMEGVYAC